MPRIFLASSGRAKPLAEALERELLERGAGTVTPWYSSSTFRPGEMTLPSVMQHACEHDLAVVLLTRDDEVIRNGRTSFGPRDNCVFEAGLFLGRLSGPTCHTQDWRDMRRVILVSTVKADELPTDLRGLTLIEIEDDSGSDVPQASMQRAALAIKDAAANLGRHRAPQLAPLSAWELMGIERHRDLPGGGTLEHDVIVSAAQPLERDAPYAAHVRNNIAQGISYHYFFHADTESVELLSELVHALAVPSSAVSLGDVRAHLEILRTRIRIHLLPHEPPFDFCIHNAWVAARAVCYLRATDLSFYEWYSGREAKRLAEEQRRLFSPAPWHGHYIFRSTTSFDLYSATSSEFRERLQGRLLEQFDSQLKEDVWRACFRPEPGSTAGPVFS